MDLSESEEHLCIFRNALKGPLQLLHGTLELSLLKVGKGQPFPSLGKERHHAENLPEGAGSLLQIPQSELGIGNVIVKKGVSGNSLQALFVSFQSLPVFSLLVESLSQKLVPLGVLPILIKGLLKEQGGFGIVFFFEPAPPPLKKVLRSVAPHKVSHKNRRKETAGPRQRKTKDPLAPQRIIKKHLGLLNPHIAGKRFFLPGDLPGIFRISRRGLLQGLGLFGNLRIFRVFKAFRDSGRLFLWKSFFRGILFFERQIFLEGLPTGGDTEEDPLLKDILTGRKRLFRSFRTFEKRLLLRVIGFPDFRFFLDLRPLGFRREISSRRGLERDFIVGGRGHGEQLLYLRGYFLRENFLLRRRDFLGFRLR
jgi:hypothetical protein